MVYIFWFTLITKSYFNTELVCQIVFSVLTCYYHTADNAMMYDKFLLHDYHIKGDNNLFKFWSIWAALREKVPNVLSRCHTKRRMDGLHRLKKKKFKKCFSKKKNKQLNSCCHTKRRMDPSILLVWQRLRTLGTFSCNAAHMMMRDNHHKQFCFQKWP